MGMGKAKAAASILSGASGNNRGDGGHRGQGVLDPKRLGAEKPNLIAWNGFAFRLFFLSSLRELTRIGSCRSDNENDYFKKCFGGKYDLSISVR